MHKNITLQPDERLDEVNEHLTLIQRKNGLTFGTDAFLLSAFCRGKGKGRIADLGCGTGIIALLLAARRRYAQIFGVEIQAVFAELARRNTALNGFADTLPILRADVRALSPADFGGELDAVVCNPPYMRADTGFAAQHDEKQIARHEICGDIGDFTAAAARCLRYGGSFYCVWRPDRLPALFAAMAAAKLSPKRMVLVHDSPEKSPATVLIEARLGGAEGLSVLPPLFLHAASGANQPLTPRAQKIYDTGSFD
ncbi:MAG: methyltransferase [Clostridia bacterium]|nr:methyltransferase [Clostridia bacterium]